MSLELTARPVHPDIDEHLKQAADRVASNLAARFYDGEVPNRYHEHVESVAYEALTDALLSTDVDDVETWSGEQDLDARVERSLP